MEKAKHKAICHHCNGNGYLRESNGSYTEVHQCPTCKSQGEIEITEPTFEELETMVYSARLQ
jgi:DnaJ-class molecular chaperone